MVAKKPAPVVDRSPAGARVAKPEAPSHPDTYTVKRGDTLLGIALDHGLDHRDLARWNNITNPNIIEVGQVLRVRDPAAAVALARPAAEPGPGEAVATPYQAAPAVEGKPFSTDPTRPAAPPPVAEAPLDPGVLTTPKAVKLPYSAAALASLQGAAAPTPRPAPSLPETSAPKQGDEADAVAWSWPTQGKIVASFNENGGPKGVQIAGELGQPVLASAAGRVVYTGSGLRGYGNLVIIKHNNTYLSAYAHNRQILVKQGDNVARGQRIAEMGNSDASQVMLHFEIRREGKPVDPVRFLPPPS
jgi:lipoprotein NlpD